MYVCMYVYVPVSARYQDVFMNLCVRLTLCPHVFQLITTVRLLEGSINIVLVITVSANK